MRLRWMLVAQIAMTACSTTTTATAPLVTTFAELKAAEGKEVRVRGPVFHEKMGDGVDVDGLSILCPDLRLSDDVKEATLTGRLELWEPPVATVDEHGAISQGVEEGTRRWILRDCRQEP
jgi:hypothetical protein